MQEIIIIGGGFAGIRAAQKLGRLKKRGKLSTASITLISNKDYFEYYPAMYRVVTGSSPMQVCIRLTDILKGLPVAIVQDTITDINPATKTAVGIHGDDYHCDHMILALGSENAYFGIEGLDTLSFNFRSIHNALALKHRMELMISDKQHDDNADQLRTLHFVIVGGGASGVELAGELKQYTTELAHKHGVDHRLITIDIIERAPRLLPHMSETISDKVELRLRKLGVNVFTNRELIKSEEHNVLLRDMEIGAKTVIWTAGVKNNSFFDDNDTFDTNHKGKVIVNEFLESHPNVYVIGDSAHTQYSGLAQTALYDGAYVARNIARDINNKPRVPYTPQPVAYDIPVGPGWGVLQIGPITLFGRLAWWLRQLIDLRFYLSILPWKKAFQAFRAPSVDG